MPTLRDLVQTLRRRPGVAAVVVLGRDGLVVDADGIPREDAEHLAAVAPGAVAAAEAVGDSAERGALTTAVLEFERGLGVLSLLSREVTLLVLLDAGANASPVIYELRRSRAALAALV